MNLTSKTLSAAVAAAFIHSAAAQQGYSPAAQAAGAQQQVQPDPQQQRQGLQKAQQRAQVQAEQAAQPARQPDRAAAGAPTLGEPRVAGQTMSTSATVQSIDRSNRVVTLRGDDGRIGAVRVGPEVAAFDGIEEGDQVSATFTEAVVLSVVREGEIGTQRIESQATSQTAADERPELGTTVRTTVVADVAQIDREAGRLILRGPGDRLVELRFQDEQVLQGISEDDRVVASFVEASALSIEPGSARQPDRAAQAGVPRQAAQARPGQPPQVAEAQPGQQPQAALARADSAEPTQKLQRASDSLRDAIQRLSRAPVDQQDREAAREAQRALLDTQLALMELQQAEADTAAAAGADQAAIGQTSPAAGTLPTVGDTETMQRLMQSADQLRASIQALAPQPAGPERNRAIDQANRALLATQQAMLSHLAGQ